VSRSRERQSASKLPADWKIEFAVAFESPWRQLLSIRNKSGFGAVASRQTRKFCPEGDTELNYNLHLVQR
jgi:hypothetical protein